MTHARFLRGEPGAAGLARIAVAANRPERNRRRTHRQPGVSALAHLRRNPATAGGIERDKPRSATMACDIIKQIECGGRRLTIN